MNKLTTGVHWSGYLITIHEVPDSIPTAMRERYNSGLRCKHYTGYGAVSSNNYVVNNATPPVLLTLTFLNRTGDGVRIVPQRVVNLMM